MFDEADLGAEAGMGNTKLPKLHWCCYRGDAIGVLEWITEGGSLQETISLKNQHNKIVCGISPLFLAAQRGHLEVAKLLVENGANASTPCFIQGSTEVCTPREVANLNLHYKLARYLKRAIRQRRREEAFLAEDDDDNMSMASGASSMRSVMMRPGGGRGWRCAPLPPRSQCNRRPNVDLSTFDPDSNTQPVGSRPPPRGFFSSCCGGGSSLPKDHQSTPQPTFANSNNTSKPQPPSYQPTSNVNGGGSGMQHPPAGATGHGGSERDSLRHKFEPVGPLGSGAVNGPVTGQGSGATQGAVAGHRESSKTTQTLDRYLKDLDLETWLPE
ncbi:MAG: hypothetical protein WDW36_006342 [Sanguina aurantia]